MPDTLIPIRQWVDTYANLTTADPVLLDRQLAIESDTGLAKVGDGTTPYTLLPYVFGNTRGSGTSGQLVYWTGSQTVAGSANLSYNGATGLSISPITNATTNTGQFLVSDGGTIKYRSSSEMLSDLGATSGSGVAGQVSYWNGTTTQTGSNNLFWDAANNRLGIGTNTPGASLDVSGNIYVGNSSTVGVNPVGGVNQRIEFGNPGIGGITFRTHLSDKPFIFITSTTEQMRIAPGAVGIGIASPTTRLQIQGTGTTSATTALQVQNSTATPKLVVKDDGSIEVGRNDSATTEHTASIIVTGSETNIGLALVPKGNGAITVIIPDGTSAGGDARGNYAVDFQRNRQFAWEVASGNYSGVLSGYGCRASSSYAFVGGGNKNYSSGLESAVAGGRLNTASGTSSAVVGGVGNTASGSYSIVGGGGNNNCAGSYNSILGGDSNVISSGANAVVAGGRYNSVTAEGGIVTGGVDGRAYLAGMRTIAAGRITTIADAQTSDIRYRREITGTSKTELFLDGSSARAILALPTGATNARAWSARVQVVAICNDQGDGTIQAGDSFFGVYSVGIKRVGTATSLIGGGVLSTEEAYDTNMSDAVIDITADDTNEALKLEFTPPTTAGSTSVIRVVATVYLTEVGY